jgi:hypothetical protein
MDEYITKPVTLKALEKTLSELFAARSSENGAAAAAGNGATPPPGSESGTPVPAEPSPATGPKLDHP